MSLNHNEIEQINMLSHAANALSHVANSCHAANAILKQIERIAAGPVPGKPERAPIEQRIAAAKEASVRGLYGLFAELAKDQDTSIRELTAVAQELGHTNVGVITI